MQLRGSGVQWPIHSQKYLLLITPTLYSIEVLNGDAWDRCWTCSWVSENRTFNSDSLHRVQIPAKNTATDNIEPTGCERGQRWGHVRLPSRCCPARPKPHMARPPQRTSPLFSPPNKSVFESQLLTRSSCGLLRLWPCECVSGVCLAVFCWVSTKDEQIDYLCPRNDVCLALLKVLPLVIANINDGKYHSKQKGRPKLDMYAFLRE